MFFFAAELFNISSRRRTKVKLEKKNEKILRTGIGKIYSIAKRDFRSIKKKFYRVTIVQNGKIEKIHVSWNLNATHDIESEKEEVKMLCNSNSIKKITNEISCIHTAVLTCAIYFIFIQQTNHSYVVDELA
jgi:hypothetical protein